MSWPPRTQGKEVYAVFQRKFDFGVREDASSGLTSTSTLIPELLCHLHHGQPLVYFILSSMFLQVLRFNSKSGSDPWGPSVDLCILSLMRAVAQGFGYCGLPWASLLPHNTKTRETGTLWRYQCQSDIPSNILPALSCLSALDYRETPAQLLRAEVILLPRSANCGP